MYNVHRKLTEGRCEHKMIVVKEPDTLKKDLTTNGNTMTSVAEKIGCSKAYISSIVSGVRNPNANVAVKLCELLEKPFERYFFIQSVNKK